MPFSDREKTTLRSFVEAAKRLEDHSLIKNKSLKVSFTIKFVKEDGGAIETSKFDDELIDSLLVRLRLFYLEQEDIFLPKVINLLKREFSDPALRSQLDDVRNLSVSRKKHGFILFQTGNSERTSEDIWKAYLYAGKFHNDACHRAVLDELKNIDDIVYTSFINSILNKTKAVQIVKAFLLSDLADIVS